MSVLQEVLAKFLKAEALACEVEDEARKLRKFADEAYERVVETAKFEGII
jgi:hypothetical protein